MDFKMFQEVLQKKISAAVKERIGGNFTIEEVGTGEGTGGIIFLPEGGLAGIAVNTMDYYAAFQAGRPMEEIVEEASATLKENVLDQAEKQVLERMAEPQNIVPVLIPREGNEELLEEIPHIAFGKMEIIFKFILLEPVDGMNVSCNVPTSYIEECGWDEERLLEVAMDSQMYKGQIHVMPFRQMADTLLMGNDGKELESDWDGIKEDSMKLVLITNSLRLYGAAEMLDKVMLERLSNIYSEDLYILPASIHECLAVPMGAMPLGNLQEMLQDINQNHLTREDWLSDDVYVFDRHTRDIRIAHEK